MSDGTLGFHGTLALTAEIRYLPPRYERHSASRTLIQVYDSGWCDVFTVALVVGEPEGGGPPAALLDA